MYNKNTGASKKGNDDKNRMPTHNNNGHNVGVPSNITVATEKKTDNNSNNNSIPLISPFLQSPFGTFSITTFPTMNHLMKPSPPSPHVVKENNTAPAAASYPNNFISVLVDAFIV